MSKPAAAQAYLRAVRPVNRALDAVKAAARTDSLAKLKAAAATYAVALRRFNQVMLATRWPADVQPSVDKLIEAGAEELVAVRALARAPNQAAADAAADDFAAAKTGTYVELVRVRLGLPPAT